MIGQTVDYNITVDDGKSTSGVIISYYTGLLISISEYGSFVFHNGANQKVIYEPKKDVTFSSVNVGSIISTLYGDDDKKEELLLEKEEEKLDISVEDIKKEVKETVVEKVEVPTSVKEETNKKAPIPTYKKRKK